MPKGYCEVEDVAGFLGTSFEGAQVAQCSRLISSVEAMIDTVTNRGWLVGEQEDEIFWYPDSRIYLRFAPVASIEEVRAQTSAITDWETLTTADYLVDLSAGWLRPAGRWMRLAVDYTPVDAVPEDIRHAATEWTAFLMQPSLQPQSYGLDSYSLPDLTVRFARSHTGQAMPPTVAQILAHWRYLVTG
jgi:hypothetical protein